MNEETEAGRLCHLPQVSKLESSRNRIQVRLVLESRFLNAHRNTMSHRKIADFQVQHYGRECQFSHRGQA